MYRIRAALALAVALVAAGSLTSTAVAKPTGIYPSWTITPADSAAQTHTGTITFGITGMPDATFTITKPVANADATSELLNASTGGDWFGTETPFGAIFGASGPAQPFQYIEASAADESVTTTITFASPVPAGVLGIAVGDLDVDEAVFTGKNGSTTLTGAQLQGSADPVGFNFCNVTADIPTNCAVVTYRIPSASASGSVTTFDVPTWTAGSKSGTAKGTMATSDGATAWLRPSTKIRELKIVFRRADGETGRSSFRLWAAALLNNVAGKVTKAGRGVKGVTVKLYGPGSSKALATTKTAAGGLYVFPGIAATNGYKVKITAPKGTTASPASKTANIAVNDALTVNFTLRKKATTPKFTG
ncbi:unannotated protein [freshwater metagenome]|uniref:Unannotated protein n=1 Tax=freshwater metagenome TaxID=449393 RepID=A0A6J7J2K9_9ZZZZ|nr:hypothetical protein [Actinomycetota bacterium]